MRYSHKLNVEDYNNDNILRIWRDIQHNNENLNILSKIILDAIDLWASDIHYEPMLTKIRVRYRIDWILNLHNELPNSLKKPFMRSIKNIFRFKDWHIDWLRFDEKINVKNEDNDTLYDLRISILPMVYWDKMVIRILKPNQEVLDFSELWMNKNILKKYLLICWMSDWIIIVTWPTWSGKTTTLHTTLNYLNKDDINIVTVEDPIEYTIDWVNQMNAWWRYNLSYSEVIKSTLRQDPDILFFWEMRDKESAEATLTAWQTWHLLFSTLHTSDAISAISRLFDMWIKPFLLWSTLVSIIWQRLIRKVCSNCQVDYLPNNNILEYFNLYIKDFEKYIEDNNIKFKKWCWCEKCNFTWYKWRIWIFEILWINETIKRLVLNQETSDEIEKNARQLWMVSMIEDWILKVIKWETTMEEVLRVFTKFQIPKEKRTIDEIKFLLDWDISEKDLYKEIISWINT